MSMKQLKITGEKGGKSIHFHKRLKISPSWIPSKKKGGVAKNRYGIKLK
jgi:hypothetical protein